MPEEAWGEGEEALPQELAADRVGVLAECGEGAERGVRFAHPSGGWRGERDGAARRADGEAAQVGVLQDGFDVVDAGEGDLGLLQAARQRGDVVGAEAALRERVRLGPVVDARLIAGEAWITGEARLAQHLGAED